MTEQELRALVRDAIARTSSAKAGVGGARAQPHGASPDATAAGHSSHAMFTLAPGDPEGRCMIEPGVPCNHCGYCKSYGH